MNDRYRVALGALLIYLGGCAATANEPPPVTHVVVCWLKSPGDAAARQEVIRATRSLKAIPGVRDVRVGPVLPSTRPVVDSSYDIALVMEFDDEGALREYERHPLHQQVVRETIKRLVERFIVYDFTEGSDK